METRAGLELVIEHVDGERGHDVAAVTVEAQPVARREVDPYAFQRRDVAGSVRVIEWDDAYLAV